MKKRQLIMVMTTVLLALAACNRVPNTGKVELNNQLDSLSYALGFYEANAWKNNLKQTPFDTIEFKQVALALKNANLLERYLEFRKNQFDTIDVEIFKKGFFNELAYGQSYFTEMTADIYIRQIFQQIRQRKDSLKNKEARNNLNKGKTFLQKNAMNNGVISLESGLQYQILKEGNGPKPKITDQVRCTYHGTLLDGTVFDSSVERGDTATFRVNKVIKGWQEALTLMPVGAKWKLFVPSDMAYGNKGAGDKIGPNETLIFEVELIDIL
ncbi:FKBP-type peptidyl-prolyl cis-trans isomerase [Thermophagus sp. OGC60D27]|uniref:FKBP-type peptidyl-prolyl cis-trans isomerase n=1 Tax=Thermophagus sp. OGC60D27 TaxID=3458415 RepID=UPI0040382F4F